MNLAEPVDPAAQVKGLRVVAGVLVAGGLMVGIVLPAVLNWRGIVIVQLSSGYDAAWFAMWAAMVLDFVAAAIFWRRAAALDRAAQGLPPRGQ